MSKRRKVKSIPTPARRNQIPMQNQIAPQIMEYISMVRGEMDQSVDELQRRIQRAESKVHNLEVENDILIRLLVASGAFRGFRIPRKVRAKLKGKMVAGGWGIFSLFYRAMRQKYQMVDQHGNLVGRVRVYHYNHDKPEDQGDSSESK